MTPPYAAELRVYEPLSAFPEPERRRWEQYVASRAAPSPRDGGAWQRLAGLAAACRPAPRVPRSGEVGEHAYVLASEVGPLVCPWRTEPRCWAAAEEAAELLAPQVLAGALPDADRELAAREHERWLAAAAGWRTPVLTSRWAVPVRWFLLFDREERRLALGPRPARAGGPAAVVSVGGRLPPPPPAGSPGAISAVARSLIYRTPMGQARRRTARGLSVLRRTFDGQDVVAAVQDQGRWLEEFHPRAVVELDYCGLVDLRSDAELRADDSAGDVAAALAGLADGDASAAGKAYDRVMERWRHAQRAESAN